MPTPRASMRLLNELEGAAQHALEVLARLGADHAEVRVGEGRELEVTVRDGAPELVKEAQSRGLSVRVIRHGKVATSSTTDLERDAVERFLARALEMASISEDDPDALPPDPKQLTGTSDVDLDLFDAKTDRIDAAKAIKLALAGEHAAMRADKRITTSEGTSFSRSSGHSVLATSGGFVGRSCGTYQSLVVQVVADDEGGKKRNGVFWTGARHYADLDTPAEIGREAARRAVASLGARKIKSGKYPIVFDREAAKSIVGLVAGCVLGDSVYRQHSYLAGKLGKRMGSDLVTLVDHPLIERGPGSRTFDGEGRKTKRRVVAKSGILESYLLDTYSARKLGLAPTGSASGGGGIPHASTSNFYLAAGRSSPESLRKGIERGLYVVRMMGFGFDATTGNFSRGAEGFLIENGELTQPVGEITISRNIDAVLKGIDKVANDLEHKTSTSSPSFRVDWMTVAGE